MLRPTLMAEIRLTPAGTNQGLANIICSFQNDIQLLDSNTNIFYVHHCDIGVFHPAPAGKKVLAKPDERDVVDSSARMPTARTPLIHEACDGQRTPLPPYITLCKCRVYSIHGCKYYIPCVNIPCWLWIFSCQQKKDSLYLNLPLRRCWQGPT